ncbi:hypothetical protein ACJRO7_015620 [Eucalyptus globulus]|uniref:Uncharacterized protein n=1 Tax=Eucalyptus globulus TaxID=34317 RepID=A0ABD3L486_EUCGL
MTHVDCLVTASGVLWFCRPLNVIDFDDCCIMAADMSQQVQAAMENMLKMINEADQSSAGIIEDIEKCRNSALERKKGLEEEKKQFQRAAYAVIDMLNVGN